MSYCCRSSPRQPPPPLKHKTSLGSCCCFCPPSFWPPLVSTALKFFAISRLSPADTRTLRRDLVRVGILDFLLWEVGYPLGAPLALRFLNWWTTERYLVGGFLVVFLLDFLVHRRFLGKHWDLASDSGGRYKSQLILTGLAALTPVLVVLLGSVAFGLGNLF